MKEIRTDIQIRFADCDILQHINNVNLQHYFDLGKNEYSHQVLGTEVSFSKVGMITAHTDSSYFQQTRLNEKIFVTTGIEKVGTKSITFLQRIISHTTSEIKAESRSVLVAYNFELQETIQVPKSWRDAIQE